MDQEIKKIVSDILQSDAKNIRLITLGTLYDLIKFGQWNDEELSRVVQKMLTLVVECTDLKIRQQLGLNLEEALTGGHELNISFDSLTEALDNSEDNSFIGLSLYILSLSYDRKYLPFMQKYLNHPNEYVVEKAKKSIDFLEQFGT